MKNEPKAEQAQKELERLGNEIATLSACIDAATHRLLGLLAEFDRRGGWNDGACRSCAHWLSWRIGLDLGAAREKVRVARALEKLPQVSEALLRGQISYSKVRALTRVATPESEQKLLETARFATASQVERIVRAWRRVDAVGELQQARRQNARRYLDTFTDEDGMLVVRARLTPEVGAAFLRAVEAAEERLYRTALSPSGVGVGPQAISRNEDRNPSAETSPRERRADALGLVAESALGGGLDTGHRTDRYQVVVHVNEAVLADPSQPGRSHLEDGVSVSAEIARRIACDSSRVVMRHGADGGVLDVGRKTRTVPPALRRALEQRDETCRFPGCGARVCHAHHLRHWANGGETKLTNLCKLCHRHHACVHEGGFRVELLPDGELRFYRPDGRLIPNAPERPALREDPVAALMSSHRDRGLDVEGWATQAYMTGEPLDLDWAMVVLRN